MHHPPIGRLLRRRLNSALYAKSTDPNARLATGSHWAMAVFYRMDKAFLRLTKGARPRVRRRALQRILAKATK